MVTMLARRRRLRLPRHVAKRPVTPAPDGPVVLLLPAHDEAPRIAGVIERLPATVAGHPTICLVVDDGSTDATVQVAAAHRAHVVEHGNNRGLGAAVRTGFAEALRLDAAALAFCDADGEYDPAELVHLVGPILGGEAHYVVGSRFAGRIERMHPHRRFGNQLLTGLTRWVSRQEITDGQSGFRALSAEAMREAVIIHDYNYAQVLTLDLVARGFGYREVPITYRFRSSGRSFVRVGRYLRTVLPAIALTTNLPRSDRVTATPGVHQTHQESAGTRYGQGPNGAPAIAMTMGQ